MASLPRILLAAALCLGAGAHTPEARAQVAAAHGPETSFQVHGTVVDGVTGKPIARALVTTGDRRIAAITNDEGAFALTVATTFVNAESNATSINGAALPLMLQIQKPGYFAPENVQSVTLDGLSTEVTLKLMPAGEIAGHVFAEGASDARNVPVMLMQHSVDNGDRHWTQMAMQQTGRNGSFHFSNLRPGEYTVMTTEWRGPEGSSPKRDAITQEYPPVFFGDTGSLASATKLHIHDGESAQAELHLRLATYYPVKIPVNAPGNMGIAVGVNTGETFGGFQLSYNGTDHAVEGSLPTGTYTLRLMSFRPQQAFGTTVLHVANAPVQGAPVALSSPAPVLVRLHREFTGSQVPPTLGTVQVYLQPALDGTFASGSTKPGQEDAFEVPNVAPGKYWVRFPGGYGYAAAIEYAGVDLRSQPLVIGEGGATGPIDITLRDDGGQVRGTVAGLTGAIRQNSFVCLLPVSPGAQFSSQVAFGDGKFDLRQIVPGDYRLMAVQGNPWQLPYRDPEAMQILGTKGVAVTVTPNADLTIDAPLVEESAMGLP